MLRWLGVLSLSVLLLAGCGKRQVDHTSYPGGDYGTYGKLPDGSGGTRKIGKPYKVAGNWYYPLSSARGYDETGVASWYGRDFHGKKTANGEIYDMHAMSAAHKTLPLPTMVRVTNLDNGRSIIVRINDRGPFVKSRLIDLSKAAATALGYHDKGTARVRVQALEGGAPDTPVYANTAPVAPVQASPRPAFTPTPNYAAQITGGSLANAPATATAGGGSMYIQLGAFSSRVNADRLKNQLLTHYPDTRVYGIAGAPGIYRVRIGPYNNVDNIQNIVLNLQAQGFNNAIVVIE